jgi:hypothetical protein
MRDVTVTISFAVLGNATLEQVREFVNEAMDAAFSQEAEHEQHGGADAFAAHNGEPVQSVEWDDEPLATEQLGPGYRYRDYPGQGEG